MDNYNPEVIRGNIKAILENIYEACEKYGRKYLRIIDYKSGHKTFDLQYVFYGLDVQMLMYLCALGENGKTA